MQCNINHRLRVPLTILFTWSVWLIYFCCCCCCYHYRRQLWLAYHKQNFKGKLHNWWDSCALNNRLNRCRLNWCVFKCFMKTGTDGAEVTSVGSSKKQRDADSSQRWQQLRCGLYFGWIRSMGCFVGGSCRMCDLCFVWNAALCPGQMRCVCGPWPCCLESLNRSWLSVLFCGMLLCC